MVRNFLGTDEWPDEEILALLERARRLKAGEEEGDLRGKILGMVFFNPSLRTRTSFEAAMLRSGGDAIYLEPGKGVWAFETRPGVVMDGKAAEHLVEAARVLGRYVDALGVRAFPAGEDLEEAFRDRVVRGFAENAGVPVINFESARRHPCQGLADAMTLQEKLGKNLKGKRFTLTWTWHPNPLPTAVPGSALIGAARLGMDLTLACPPGYDLYPDDMKAIRGVAERNGASLEVTRDMDEAVEGAHAVYAKSWGSLEDFGNPEKERARRAAFKDWIVNEKRMSSTAGGRGIFLHCLPVRRGVVVTEGVLEGPWSVVVDQAENRMHAQRALLLELLK